MTRQTSAFPYTIVASIVRTRGLRGELLCELLTDFPEKFEERKRLFLLPSSDVEAKRSDRAREVSLQDFWMPSGKNAGRIVLQFAGYESIELAETLLGMAVAVPTDQRASLEPDTWYASDLLGCEVFNDGVAIGAVAGVDLATTGSTLLIVKGSDGKEILIPLVKAYLVSVDVANKRIEMRLPEGLVEINS